MATATLLPRMETPATAGAGVETGMATEVATSGRRYFLPRDRVQQIVLDRTGPTGSGAAAMPIAPQWGSLAFGTCWRSVAQKIGEGFSLVS